MNIAEWSIRKPLLTWTVTILVIVAGVLAYYQLPRLEDPEFTIKEAQIITAYPGASPRETAQEVTSKIEEAVQQMGQLKEIQSKSSYGLSIVRAEMRDKYDRRSLPQIWDELRNKIADSHAQLPPGASEPRVIDDYGDVYGAFYALTGKGATHVQLHEFAKYLQKQLLFVRDVKKIELFGVLPEALYVTLNRVKMGSLGIAPEDIFKILKERNLVSDEGWIGIGGEWLPIKMDAGGITPEAIRHIVISRRTDSLITLGDVATVTLSKKEPPPEMLFFNGEPAVGIGISTVSGGNVVKMGESIQKKLAELAPVFPAEMKLHTISMQSDSVSRAVRGFVENLAEAVAIVIVVLLIFMGFRSGLLIGFVLFLTICGTLFVMNAFQIALQRVSLGALIIALYIKNAYNILMFAWSFYAAAAGLPAFAALYWKKATKAGILSGMAAGSPATILWKLIGLPFGIGATVPGAIACALALVLVSLATYKKAPTPFLDPYAKQKEE